MQQTLTISGIDLELWVGGKGSELLCLHGAEGFQPDAPYARILSAKHRVIAPSHPGFGGSSLPEWLDSVDDIAHLYLELVDRLGLAKFDLLGCSIGGWIAAELATRIPERLRRLVLVGPVGVKLGSRDRLDIPDIFAMSQQQLDAALYHDPDKVPIPTKMPDDELRSYLRSRESVAMLAWEPYMHSPKLKHRLHRVGVPTLFLRGENDGLVSAGYLGGYAALLPDARTDTIAAAGHFPHLEKPDEFCAKVLSFVDA